MKPHLAAVLLGLAMAGGAWAAPDEPPADAVLAELPFLASDEPNRIIVDLGPDGRPFPLLLDTGAVESILTPRTARALGVSIRPTRQDPYRRRTRLGRDLLFRVDTRRSDTASQTGWEYGLLGGNFLADYVVELDFEARRVRLLDPRRYAVPEAASDPEEAVLSLGVVSNRPSLELSVAGQRFPAMIDTGDPTGLSVDAKTAKRVGIASRLYADWHSAGVWGEVASELGSAERMELGPFAFLRVPVEVLPNGFFNMGLADQALVGIDVLSQFRVRIDYPHQRLALRRRPQSQPTWLARPWTNWAEYFAAASPAAPPPAESPAPEPAREGALPAPAVSLASAPAAAPARPPGPAPAEQVWLEIDAPQDGETHAGRVGWLEVRGLAGAQTALEHDVVVVVDVSGSTAYASGADVDGDGEVGRTPRHLETWRSFNPHHFSSDTGDTILAAELTATRKLVGLLDPARTRVGLVSFSDGASLLAPVGSDAEALGKALGVLQENFGAGMTNLAAATETARRALLDAGGPSRQKSILVLSDGYPTAPVSPERGAAAAWAEARLARDQGVRIYTFGLGLGEVREDDVFARMAAESGGRYVRLERPGDIVHELPRIDLARIAGIEIENSTSGEAGQALRVFPDGSFDGFVHLRGGENRVRVTARGQGGGASSLERRVVFEAREPRDADEARAFDAEVEKLRARLALRALESELAAEAREGRASQAGQGRELEVKPDRSGD